MLTRENSEGGKVEPSQSNMKMLETCGGNVTLQNLSVGTSHRWTECYRPKKSPKMHMMNAWIQVESVIVEARCHGKSDPQRTCYQKVLLVESSDRSGV